MTIEAVQEEQTQETTESNKHPGLDHLDDNTRNEILSLRNEAKDRRLKNKDLQKELEELKSIVNKAKEDKMIEEGKLQELLGEKEKELESLKPLAEKVAAYEKQFETQLDAVVSKLTPEQQELINDSGWSLDKKLTWATKLAEQIPLTPNGPDSKRPGGDQTNIDDINLDDYRGPQGRKRLAMLKHTNPKQYDKILNTL